MKRWFQEVPAHIAVELQRFFERNPTGTVTLDMRHGHILSGSIFEEANAPDLLGEPGLPAEWFVRIPTHVHDLFDRFLLDEPTGHFVVRIEQGIVQWGHARRMILEDRSTGHRNGNGRLPESVTRPV